MIYNQQQFVDDTGRAIMAMFPIDNSEPKWFGQHLITHDPFGNPVSVQARFPILAANIEGAYSNFDQARDLIVDDFNRNCRKAALGNLGGNMLGNTDWMKTGKFAGLKN